MAMIFMIALPSALMAALCFSNYAGSAWHESDALSVNVNATADSVPVEKVSSNEADIEKAAKVSLDRPLFSRDRRPYESAIPLKPPLPRLTGTIITSTLRAAIFEGKIRGSVVVLEGGKFQDFVVATVNQDSIVVSNSHEKLVIRPSFSSEPVSRPYAVLLMPTPHPNGSQTLYDYMLNAGSALTQKPLFAKARFYRN